MSQHSTEVPHMSPTKGVADALVWSTAYDRNYYPPRM